MNAVDWIVANTELPLKVVRLGRYATPDGSLAFVDPLGDATIDFFSAPVGEAQMVAFLGEHNRISKFALVYAGTAVVGGMHKGVAPVDAGSVSPVTKASFAVLRRLQAQHDNDPGEFYEEYLEEHHNSLENCIACTLPGDVPMPIVDSGWGDGWYHSFALTDETGATIAIYIDFMGRNADGAWLMPPGVHLN